MSEQLSLEYLFKDRPPAATPADYDMLCVKVGGAELYGELMWPYGNYKKDRPCVLICHGYPGVARNDDLAFALRRIGCVVLTPHHRGAWGSQGTYLISNCVEDAVYLYNYVQSSSFREKYHIDPCAVFLIGHSMGGNSVLQAARKVKGLRGLVLLAPYDPTRFLRDRNEAPLRTLLETGFILHSDGIGAILEDIKRHLEDYAFEDAYPDIKDLNICCFTATLDTIAPPWMVKPLWSRLTAHKTETVQRLVELPSAHGFCNSRITLIRETALFLDAVLSRPMPTADGASL